MPVTFGPYALESELGHGAMGVVYRARHIELDRPVALKVLHHAGPQMAERFRREALATARLRHANIVTVHDAGQIDGIPFLAMELVEGGPLELERLPLRRRVEILAKVSEAVHHAHIHGIVHRDLKPANILLDTAQEPRLVDFGLAHLEARETRLTRSGTALGTPLYMSPEQVRGEKIGAASDVYALGVLLYEALSGRTPFASQSVEQLYPQILSSDPPALKNVPAELATIAYKCLEKSPARRYGTAQALADDLRRWLDDKPIQARPPSVAYRVRKFLLRRRVLVIASAAVVIVSGGVTAILLPRSARETRLRLEREKDLARERSARATAELYLPLERDLDLLRMNFYRPDFRLDDAEFARYDAFVDRIRARMRETGESADGWYLIGRCHEVVAAGDRAEEAYARAMALDARHGRTLLARGKLALERILLKRAIRGGRHEREAVAQATQAAAWIRQGAESAGADGGMERELAEGYVEAVRDWGRAWSFSAADAMERWKGRPFVETFLLLEGFASGQVEPACEAILARMPSSFEARFWLGVARQARGNMEAAIMEYGRAIDINPRHLLGHHQRAGAIEQAGRVEEALQAYTEITRLYPEFPDAWYNRGRLREDRGLLAEALSDYDRAIALDPDDPDIYNNRANIFTQRGEIDRAIADYTTAVRIDPHHALAYYNRGNKYFEQKRMTEAIADYTAAIAADPKHVGAHYNRGNSHLALEDRARALADYTEVLRLDPEYYKAYVNRAAVFAAMDRTGEAIADMERALKHAPTDWPNRVQVQEQLDAMKE